MTIILAGILLALVALSFCAWQISQTLNKLTARIADNNAITGRAATSIVEALAQTNETALRHFKKSEKN